MANAYKIPYKKKLQASSNLDENGKTSLPQKRKLSSDLPEDEIGVQANSPRTKKRKPFTKVRKNKRLIEKETQLPIDSKNNKVALKIASNNITNYDSTGNHIGVTKKNFQANSTIQENTTKVEHQITEKIVELKENSKVRVFPEIKQNNFKMKNEISTPLCETLSQKDGISQSQKKIEIDHVDLNIKSSSSACPDLNEPNLILNDNLKESISFKAMNIDELQTINIHKSVNLQIQDLKIIKVVLEDPYKSCDKDNYFIDENKNEEIKLKNSHFGMLSNSSQMHLENNEQDTMVKNDDIINLQEETPIGFEGKLANKEIISESTADMQDQMNENYGSSDIKNKTPTVNEANSNTLSNSIVFDTTIAKETHSMTTSSMKNKETDKITERIDSIKSLPNPKRESKLEDIKNISATKHNYNNQSNKPTITKTIFGNELKLHKKTLTIPCMSALDYEKECEKKSASSLLNEKEILETENSPSIFTNINLEALEQEYFKTNTYQILKDTEFDKMPAMNKTQCKDDKQTSVDATTFNISVTHSPEKSIVPSNQIIKKLNLEGDLVKEEIYMDLKNSYNFNKMEEEIRLQGTASTSSIKDVEKLKPINRTEIIFSDENLIAESITFREKVETDDSNIIPTGTFKHLNEIYECNKGTISELLQEFNPVKSYNSKERAPPDDIVEEIEDTCKLKRKTEQLVEDSNFLLTASDYIKPRKSCEISINQNNFNLQNCENEVKDKNQMYANKALKKNEEKEDFKSNNQESSKSDVNEISRKVIEEISISQNSPQDGADFLGIETCMEMDDDFALTASQLKMLDADEKMQCQSANKCTTSQQTDICGYTYFGNDAVTFEIINQLQYLRESVEYIRNILEKSSNDENTSM